MKQQLGLLLSLCLLSPNLFAETRFGETLCKQVDYYCLQIHAYDSWDTLFPNHETKDLIRRINRMNVRLKEGMILAVPKQLDRLSIYDISPFPRYIEPTGEKGIYISQKNQAWGAYDERGELIWWGPISSGIGECSAPGGCATPTGLFRVIRKQDAECISTTFPRREEGESGGAEMPYCMHFFRGYALHGSEDLPGYRASHGCIRLFTEDARWLNEEFVDLPGGNMKGTPVIIEGLN
jgi:hypothetical protein